jgi:hypothetical protein
LVVQVYADGSAYITQGLMVNSSSSSIQVPLLSSVLSNVLATDQNGSPLSFSVSGSNITVYTLGATRVTLKYDTLNLTSKTGTVWTLQFVTSYNTTVVLPKLSTLSYTSGSPYSLQTVNQSPVLSIAAGSWKFGYGVSIGSISTNSTQGPGGVVALNWWQLELVGAVAVAAVGGLLLVRWWRGRVDLGPGEKT